MSISPPDSTTFTHSSSSFYVVMVHWSVPLSWSSVKEQFSHKSCIFLLSRVLKVTKIIDKIVSATFFSSRVPKDCKEIPWPNNTCEFAIISFGLAFTLLLLNRRHILRESCMVFIKSFTNKKKIEVVVNTKPKLT